MNENMKVSIAGVEFKNPVITASGCFGFGRESVTYLHVCKDGPVFDAERVIFDE